MRKKLNRRRPRKLSLEGLEGRRLLAQVVAAVPATQTVDLNDTFMVATNYSTVPEEMTTGVSLRLHYNADLVSFDVGDITIPPAPAPQPQGSPFIGDDTTEDGDNDPTTTMFVQVDFVDFNGTFPTELSPLFEAIFTATAAGTANFNYIFRNATGATSSTPATVTINPSTTLAGQVAMASPASQTVAVNDMFTVTTNYSTLPAMQTAGVSLRLHYNANLVSFDVNNITVPPTPAPQTQGSPFIGDDTTEDGDNDPTTTMFVQVDFVDFNGTFPTELSPLFDAMFTAVAAGSANFNYSFRNATGMTGSTPATVTINAAPMGQIATATPATQTVNVNDTFTVTTNYSTLPAMQTAGVSLRLHYNANLVSFDVNNITVPPTPAPQTQGSPFIGDDTTEDGDNDPTTTMFVQVDFVDFNGTFPTELSPLFDAMFTATAMGTANFNYSFRNATGTTSSTPATVTINPVSTLPTVGVTVSPSSVLEDGTNNLTYTFTRTGGDTTQPLTVNYSTSGDATAGTDYTGTSTSVVILANQTEATVIVDPTADTDPEGDETVILTISPNTNVYIVDTTSPSATGTIIDDEVVLPTVSVSVNPDSVLEDGTNNLTYTFTRTGGDTTQPLTVNYATSGDAIAGTDYTGTSTSVVILANETEATVIVAPTADTDPENDETVVLTISADSAYNVSSTSPSATGTIIDDDVVLPTVSVSVNPDSVLEDGTNNLTYTFTRTGGDTTQPLTVNYATSGDATAGTDYTGTSTSVVILANETEATVIVDPTADTDPENDETVVLTISADSAYNVSSTSPSATGTIIDDEVVLPTVSVSVNPDSVLEDGTNNLTYTFTRTGGNTTQPLTVNYATSGDATAGTDYTGTSTSVVILANETEATVIVDPTADTDPENDETVILTISADSAYNVSSTSPSATGTIIDDEVVLPTVSVSVSPNSVIEDGANNLTYTFARTGGDTTQPLTVNYATSGDATAGTDYTGTSTSVVILANQTEATVIVDPTADTDPENDETVVLTISADSAYNVSSTSPSATGTIIDDDPVLPTVSVSVNPDSVLEDGANNLTYTFTRTGGDTTQPLTVNYATGGDATPGTDYTGTSTSVVILANQTEATVVVDPTADTTDENDETVVLTISPNSSVYIVSATSPSATGTIIDDDEPPLPTVSVAVSPSSVLEDGTTNLTYTFTRTGGDTTQPLTVNYATSGSATAGSDYTGTSTSVVILANQTQATVIVDPTADNIAEPDETVVLTISPNSSVYNVGTPSATGTIIDNDPLPPGTRFLSPEFVARPHLIPGDGLATAILFRANTNTTLTVGQVGVASLTEEVMLLDEGLNSVGGQSSGVYNANLLAGNLYALVFMARSTDSIFVVRSSAGFESLSGSSTNLLRSTDVNADGESTVLDALLVINQLSRHSNGEGEEVDSLVQAGRYYDVNMDGKVTAGDALRVINELARQNTAGQGEQLAASVAQEKICVPPTGTADDGLVGILTASAGEEPEMAAASTGPAWVNQPVVVVNLDAAEEISRSVDESLSDESFLDQLALS